MDKFATIQIEKERPDWRGTLTADYSRGQSDVLVRGRRTTASSTRRRACATRAISCSAGRRSFDVEAGRRFSGVRWSLGARNLFDTFPDKNTLDNGYGIFPWAGASPFGYNGRFVYTRAEMVFGR